MSLLCVQGARGPSAADSTVCGEELYAMEDPWGVFSARPCVCGRGNFTEIDIVLLRVHATWILLFTCTYLCTCCQVLTWLETNARAVAQKYKAADSTFAEHTQRWEMCLYMTVCTTYVWAYFRLCCAQHPMRFSSTCVSLVSSSLLKCHSVTGTLWKGEVHNQSPFSQTSGTGWTQDMYSTCQCPLTLCYGWWWLWSRTPVISMSTRHSLN